MASMVMVGKSTFDGRDLGGYDLTLGSYMRRAFHIYKLISELIIPRLPDLRPVSARSNLTYLPRLIYQFIICISRHRITFSKSFIL